MFACVNGQAIMRRVALRLLNRDKSDCVVMWRQAQVADYRRERAELIMRRVGGRMRHKDKAMNFTEWVRNYRNGMAAMWQNRNAKLQEEFDTLQLEYQMATQAGAERIMKNVAMKILHQDLAAALVMWKQNYAEAMDQARAEVIHMLCCVVSEQGGVPFCQHHNTRNMSYCEYCDGGGWCQAQAEKDQELAVVSYHVSC